MEKQFALCSNKKCYMRAMCLRQFLFKSELHDVTDEVEEFSPNEDGECEHFLPFHQTSEDDTIDNTNEE
jgi:hypothetical protein